MNERFALLLRSIIITICVCMFLLLSSCMLVRDEERMVSLPSASVVVPSPPEPSAAQPTTEESTDLLPEPSADDATIEGDFEQFDPAENQPETDDFVAESPALPDETPASILDSETSLEDANVGPDNSVSNNPANSEVTEEAIGHSSLNGQNQADQQEEPYNPDLEPPSELVLGLLEDEGDLTDDISNSGDQALPIENPDAVDASNEKIVYTADSRSVTIVSILVTMLVIIAFALSGHRYYMHSGKRS